MVGLQGGILLSSKVAFLDVDFDNRWVGPHGIGRFARELSNRITFGGYVALPGLPTSPFGVIWLTARHIFYSKRFVFSPGYNAPLLGLKRYILTVHDLNHIDFRGAGALKKLYYEIVLKRACRRAAKVLTVSEYSRRQIIRWACVEDDQVVNVGNGVGEMFSLDGPLFDSATEYLLMVSNRKPHKNEERVLRAFAQAEFPCDIRLLITGRPDKAVLNILSECKLEDRVEFIGSPSDRELASIYRRARGLVFASLYEGFGLPVIEAMACGTPVIASNICSLPEVAGDAALFVDPNDINDIRATMEYLVSGGDSLRGLLASRGLVQASQYSWDAVSGRVVKVLTALSSDA